jgi:hypothetical protein
MFTFETSDQKEVRRLRIAQFNGRTTTARSSGSAVTGLVRSIAPSKSGGPAAWTITIIAKKPKAAALPRPAPRTRPLMEDFREAAE